MRHQYELLSVHELKSIRVLKSLSSGVRRGDGVIPEVRIDGRGMRSAEAEGSEDTDEEGGDCEGEEEEGDELFEAETLAGLSRYLSEAKKRTVAGLWIFVCTKEALTLEQRF